MCIRAARCAAVAGRTIACQSVRKVHATLACRCKQPSSCRGKLRELAGALACVSREMCRGQLCGGQGEERLARGVRPSTRMARTLGRRKDVADHHEQRGALC